MTLICTECDSKKQKVFSLGGMTICDDCGGPYLEGTK